MKNLNSNSGLHDPYHCYAVYKVKKRLEDLKLHSLIDTLDPSLRHAKNREFYEMDYQKAYDILSAIAQINGDEEQLVINPFSESYIESMQLESDSDKDYQNNDDQKKNKLRFSMIGVPIGSKLVFVKDSQKSCSTLDDNNRVLYNGEEYSISSLAAKLLNSKSAQGGKYFTYNGERLIDIREKLGVENPAQFFEHPANYCGLAAVKSKRLAQKYRELMK